MAGHDESSSGLPGASLRFADPEVERAFCAAYDHRVVPIQRLACVLGIGLYAAFGILDVLLAGEAARDFLTIRFALVIPVVALALLATFVRRIRPAMQLVFCGVVVVAGFGITAMVALADPFVAATYYGGLMLTVMFGATLTRLRTGWMALASILVVGGYEVAALALQETSGAVLINNNFFLLSATLISLGAAWLLERSDRRDFLRGRTLEEHARRVTELNLRLEQLSTRDHLTGLYNRRYLERRLSELGALHERYPMTTTVLMLDLDGFKEVNDAFGHPAGDQALRAVAASMSGALRATDLLFRLGGDEFVVVLHNTGLAAARRVSDNLRSTLTRLPLPGEMGQTGVAFSAGAVELRKGEAPERTLERLDELLYRAKAEGKGRTVFEGDI